MIWKGKFLISRVLIYRLGSLGDTVVALPCFHLIRRKFPKAELRVLTNAPVANNAPALFSVLDGSGLVDGYFEYPVSTKNPSVLWALVKRIRGWGPEMVVYLAPRHRRRDVARDWLFLRLCGISRLVGMPFKSALRAPEVRADGLWERECERLARCLELLGDAEPLDQANWDLNLSAVELALAASVVSERIGPHSYIVLCIGSKLVEKDWGEDNWQRLVDGLLYCYPYKLVFIGAASDRPRSDLLGRVVPERFVNLCGDLNVRISAAVLKGAVLYIGHDSGPMHLASAVQTPLVAIFSNRDKPGKWFPIGDQVRALYPYDLNTTILSIDPRQVLQSALEIIPSPTGHTADSVYDASFNP